MLTYIMPKPFRVPQIQPEAQIFSQSYVSAEYAFTEMHQLVAEMNRTALK